MSIANNSCPIRPPENEGSFLEDLNRLARGTRRARFELLKKFGIGGPTLVAEGDSWFQHPIEGDVIDWLSSAFFGYRIRSLGAAGDWLSNIVEMREFVAAIKEEDPAGFLFSGGGNDIVDGTLACLLNDSRSAKKAEECINFPNLKDEMHRLSALYRRVYSLVQAAKPTLPMFVHGYAHPVPGRKYYILLLDWGFGDRLAERNVPENLWNDVADVIIDHFNDMLAALDKNLEHLHYIDLREIIDRIDFIDELHLNSLASLKVAKHFHKKIEEKIPH